MRSILMPALVALSILIAAPALAAEAAPQPPAPGDLPDSPHPWRAWEAERRIAALERQAADKGPADPHPEQLLYDATFYDLDLDLDLAAKTLDGTLLMRARVVGESISRVVLDMDAALTASAARAAGQPTTWTHAVDHLLVDLDRTYQPGEMVEVAVDYAGDPSGAGSFGWATVQGEILVWTLSEPYGARTWWPCKDFNDDKADSVDVSVSVPDPWVVASNGVLAGQAGEDGRTTYEWRSRYPIATYLVSITAYPYTVFTDFYAGLDGTILPIENYVVPQYEQDARDGYGKVPAMIRAWRDAFGEYPFMDEKYGHAHFNWGGGMEHQTCSSMIYWYHQEYLIAHELAHQWWGDLVTCADFHHIWLNEGFATWAEAYWLEQSQGPEMYRADLAANKYLGDGTIYVEDPNDFRTIFDMDLTYNKASWVVHMLRGVLGDEDFFAGLALYRERFAYASATTEDLQQAMEDVSGQDLHQFFQQWIYGSGHPIYAFAYEMEPAEDHTLIHVHIVQTQDEPVFEMPIRLLLRTPDGGEEVVVQNVRRDQYYLLTGPPGVTSVAIDIDEWILREAVLGTITDVPIAVSAPTITARPNPFNPQTTLRLSVPSAGRARVQVVDARGRHVRTLLDGPVPAGARDVRWDGRDERGQAVAAGVYFAVLESGGDRRTARLALVR